MSYHIPMEELRTSRLSIEVEKRLISGSAGPPSESPPLLMLDAIDTLSRSSSSTSSILEDAASLSLRGGEPDILCYFATLEHELLCCCSTSESRDVFFRF